MQSIANYFRTEWKYWFATIAGMYVLCILSAAMA